MTPQQALAALLQGKPLRLRQEGSATIIEPEAASGGATVMEPIEVSASRTSSNLGQPGAADHRAGTRCLAGIADRFGQPATVLAKTVPGMADSSRTMTDYGQTLRGRGVLVLVDGIPLNTNRDSSRNLANIDPASIERVEVLRGSSSIYGAGATGGIVSITTRPAGGEPVARNHRDRRQPAEPLERGRPGRPAATAFRRQPGHAGLRAGPGRAPQWRIL